MSCRIAPPASAIIATEKKVPSSKPKRAPETISTSATTPHQPRIAPRNEKSLRVANTTTLRPVKPNSVTTAALWITPGAVSCAISSSGTKRIDSAIT